MTIDRLRELLENVECAYDLMDELYQEEDEELRIEFWQYQSSALPHIDRAIRRLKILLAQKENELAVAYRPPAEFIVQLPGERIAKYARISSGMSAGFIEQHKVE
jgi:hypothetical protein